MKPTHNSLHTTTLRAAALRGRDVSAAARERTPQAMSSLVSGRAARTRKPGQGGRKTTLHAILCIALLSCILGITISLNSESASASPVDGVYATIGESIVPIDSLVTIQLTPHPTRPTIIVISDGINTFRYNGQSVSNRIGFSPQRSGEHTLSVRDAQTGTVLETLYFMVGERSVATIAPIESLGTADVGEDGDTASDPTSNPVGEGTTSTTAAGTTTDDTRGQESAGSTSNANTDADSNTVLPTRTNIVMSDKANYVFGESVMIRLLADDMAALRLHIVKDGQVFRFLGDMAPEMRFVPNTPGAYRVVVSGTTGDTIDSFVFVVEPPIEERTGNTTSEDVDNETADGTITDGETADNQNADGEIADGEITDEENPDIGIPDAENIAGDDAAGETDDTDKVDTDKVEGGIESSAGFTMSKDPRIEARQQFRTEFQKTGRGVRIIDAKGGVHDGDLRITKRADRQEFTATMLDAQSLMQSLTEVSARSTAQSPSRATTTGLDDGFDIEFTPRKLNPEDEPKLKRIKVEGLRSTTLDLGLDDVPNDIELPYGVDPARRAWQSVYAVDPTRLNASNVTLTFTAYGTELYTCKDWDFANRACLGAWIKLRDLTPGQEYSLTLDSADPGFGETVPVPSVGWVKVTTSPVDTATLRIATDSGCTNMSTNFMPGDRVFICLNSTNNYMSDIQSNQLDIYYGADPSSLGSYAYTCNNPGGNSNYCNLSFEIPENWAHGWYYLDSDLHRNQYGRAFLFRTPIIIGTEPVEGERLEFFADSNRSRPADKFGPGYDVFVYWDAARDLEANISSNIRIKTFHYGVSGGVSGYNAIANSSITWTNNTGPYLFNFTMPTTLSDGYGGWYWFEPNVTYNSTMSIPDGNPVFGRLIQYQNNTVPNITDLGVNSNYTDLVSVGQTLMWNVTLNDTDEIDKHALYICSTPSMSFAECWTYGSSSACAAGGCTWNTTLPATQTNFTSSGSWVVPAGVTSVKIEAIGGGGAGGGRTTNGQGGGGGGGAMARSVITVIPGSTYNINVGVGGAGGTGNGPAGTNSNVTNSSGSVMVRAAGGGGGLSASTGGTSGNATNSIGTVILAGGRGGTASGAASGGGGGGAGNNTAGGNATVNAGGTGGIYYGGDGADGRTTQGDGANGADFGGGGAGARRTIFGNRAGGDGGNGIVILTYTVPVCSGTPKNSCTNSTICANASWTLANDLYCSIPANPTMGVNNTGYVFVCDAWNCSTAIPLNFSVYNDTTAPSVQLITPLNPSTELSFTVQFNYVPSDDFGFANCSLYTTEGGWTIAETNTNIENGTNNFFTHTFSGDGTYDWNVRCFDYAGKNAYAALNYTLDIAGPPVVNLMTPDDNAFIPTTTVNFTYNVSYNGVMESCVLIVNGTDTAIDNVISLNTQLNFTYELPGDGSYTWNVRCNSTEGVTSEGDGIFLAGTPRALGVDTIVPSVQLISPADNSASNESTIFFTYNASDNNIIKNCTLVVDGAPIETRFDITNVVPQSVAYILDNGMHTWYAYCSDGAGNIATSDQWHVNVSSNTTSGFIFYETNLRPGNATALTAPVNINLSTQVDGTENSIAASISGRSFSQIASARSNAFQSNGILIYPNAMVNFSGYFSAQTANVGYVTWKLYRTDGVAESLICDFGNDFTGGRQITAVGKNVYRAACQADSSVHTRLAGNESLRLVVGIYNNDNRRRTYTHYIDNRTTFTQFNFTRLGFLTTNITVPAINITAGVGDSINVSCAYNCSGGTCINTQIYLQRNQSAGWLNVTSSGSPVILKTGETNPHNLSNVLYPGGTSIFTLYANSTGMQTIRCIGTSNYSTVTTTNAISIRVQATGQPTVQLVSPANNTFTTNTTIFFTYIPSGIYNVSNCSLSINNVVNQTNTTITKDAVNRFNVSGIMEGRFLWNVTCFDSLGRNGTSPTYVLTTDVTPPGVTLVSPLNASNFTTNTVTFGWNATDGVDTNISCNLTIDGLVAAEGIGATNSSLTTRTVQNLGLGAHLWNVTCIDDANNRNTSQTWQFNITNLVPQVTAISPANNTWTSNQSVLFSYNISEPDDRLFDTSRNYSAMIVYANLTGAGVNPIPKYRIWNGTGWSAEASMPTAGSPIRWVKMATSTTLRNPREKIAITSSNDGNIDAYVWNGTGWIVTNNIGAIDNTGDGSFDVAYETNSGDALLVYSVLSGVATQDLAYRTWNGSGWSAVSYIDDTIGTINVGHVKLASNPNASSDEIALAYIDNTNNDARVRIWDGTAWNSPWNITLNIGSENEECIGIAYETLSQRIVAIAGSAGGFNHTVWNGTAWSTPGWYDPNTAAGGTTVFTELKADPKSNKMIAVTVQDNNDLSTAFWNNNAWSGATRHDATIDTTAYRVADFAWELNNSKGLLMWGTSAALLSYRNFTNTGWSASTSTVPAGANTHQWLVLRTMLNPASGDMKIIGAVEETTNQRLGSIHWFGTPPPSVTATQFTTNQGGVAYRRFDISPDRFPQDSTSSAYYGLANCSLYFNGAINATNTSAVLLEQVNYFNISNIAEGVYNWSVNCSDSDGSSNATPMRRLYVDRTAPKINLTYPLNDTFMTVFTFNVTFNATDNLAPNMTCNLTLDGTVNSTNFTAYNGSNSTRRITAVNDSYHSWNITCVDLAGNRNTSETWYFNSSAPPIVALVSPANNGNSNGTPLTLIYNVSENSAVTNCSLYFDGALNATNTTAVNISGRNNFTLMNVAEGLHVWNVSCIDDGDLIGWSTNFNVTVDFTNPDVNLSQPANMSILRSTSVLVNWTAYDNIDTMLLCNVTKKGPEGTVYRNNIVTPNGTLRNASYTGLPDGQHFWNVTCWDDTGNRINSVTWYFNITAPPTILLLSPPHNSYNSTNDVTLAYRPVYGGGISNCTLYVNGAENWTNTSITTNVDNYFYLEDLAEGPYTWQVNCTDDTLEPVNSTIRNFTIDYTPANITLYNPPNGLVYANNTVRFNYTPYDQYSGPLTCNLTVNGTVYNPNSNVNSGAVSSTNIMLRGGGRYYEWNVTCVDKAANRNTSEHWNFTLVAPPLVTLISPANNSPVIANMTLVYRPSDPYGIANCSLILDDVLNQTNITPIVNNSNNNFSISNVSGGRHNWTVLCYDNDGDQFAPDVRYFSSDGILPSVFLIAPENNTNSTTANVTFNWTAYDDIAPTLSCSVYVDSVNRGTNITQNSSVGSLSVTNIADGLRYWNVTCLDQVFNSNTSQTWQFRINQTPIVALNAPPNQTSTNNGTVVFRFTPGDNDGFRNCSISINGVPNASNATPVINNAINNITVNLTTGKYNWSVICYDNGSLSNSYRTEDRAITINLYNPNVTLNAPDDGFTTEYSSIIFNWTAVETFGGNLTCNLTINGTVRATNVNTPSGSENVTKNITGINDSMQYWNVTCVDPSGNRNTSETRNFTVTEPPRVALGSPVQNLRTNNLTINFTFTPTDNSGLIANCSLIIDGVINTTSYAVVSGPLTNITVPGFVNGTYAWSVNCTDPSGYTGNSTTRNLTIDTYPPVIQLNAPPDATSQPLNVTFNWTVWDDGSVVTCNLTIDGVVNLTNQPGSTGLPFLKNVSNFNYGPHYWNVTCWDDLVQANTSGTWNFTVDPSDLVLDSSARIAFNSTNPIENETINITANVSNNGSVAATNANISFWDGLPGGGGIFIGSVTRTIQPNQSVVVGVLWNITLGLHEIFVSVDPDNAIYEIYETNNNASRNVSVLRVLIDSPPNATHTNDNTPAVNFTVMNYTGGTFTYRVFVDNAANGQTNDVIDNTSTEINISALAEGIHRIIIQANDTTRLRNSTPLTIIVDNTPPAAAFLTLNNTFFNSLPFNITIRVNDTYDAFINYTLLVNGTADSSGTAQNATALNVSIDGLPQGVYNLTISSVDSAGNAGNSSSIIIYYDLTAPLVMLESPSDNSNFTVRTVFVNYSVTDNLDPVLQCNLTLDGAVVSSLRNITNGGSDNYTATGLGEGTHLWNATCWDGNNAVNQVNNRNTSVTRSFSVYIPPLVSLIAPPNNTWSNNDTQSFLFNVSDETGLTSCSLLLNGSIHTTKFAFELTNNDTNNFTVSGLNNTYLWAVTCTDSSGGLMVNTTGNRTITIDLDAPQGYINVTNGTWFNTSTPRINITIFDNLDTSPNWTMYLDDAYNANGTAQNGVGTTANLTGVTDGYHTIILEVRDRAGNVANSTPTIIIIDTNAPTVTLIAPVNDTNLSQTNTWLNFSAADNLAVAMRCNLTLDGTVREQYNLTNGSDGAHYVSNLVSGYHYWNVTCFDNATNRGVSETWRFYVQVPDFAVTAGNITFNNTNPVENDTVEVNATVFNIGLLNASDVIVQFWRGDPDIIGATQLGGNITVNLSIGENRTFSVNVTALIGLNQIYVVIDPPISTNGTVVESDETNNKANKDFWVGLFEVFAGGSENNLLIGDASIIAAFSWNQTNTTGSNVFVSDSESSINFIALQAIGRNSTNGTNVNTQNDFSEIDERMNTTTLNDSVNRTFTVTGIPLDYMNITAYKRNIIMIPAVNSTNTSVFRTGILWDTSDGVSKYYNKSQDIVFVTVMDQGQTGYFGTYDYEIKVPAKLRDYVVGGGTVTFYAELR